MSGLSKIYVVGEPSGFGSTDGANPIHLLVLVGDADRQWLEPHYIDRSIEPLGKLCSIVPRAPDDPDSLLDSLIAFAPAFFSSCPSLPVVRSQLGDRSRLDFDSGAQEVPKAWGALRDEARGIFEKLAVWGAVLEPIEVQSAEHDVAPIVRPLP